MGEREKKADCSSLHVLANTSELVREGLLSVSPLAQTRPNELPITFWNKIMDMHGQGVRLVLEKELYASDVNPSKGRLSIPQGQIKAKFLTDEEDRALDNMGMTVSLIEPCRQVRHMLLLQKDYKRKGYFSYLLTKKWNAVMQNVRNGLKKDCLIQLWAFRLNGALHFCLVNCEAASADVKNRATRK